MNAPKLDATLHKERDGTFVMLFCRGPGKCTKTESQRKSMSKHGRKCSDCYEGKPGDTLGQVLARVKQGDA